MSRLLITVSVAVVATLVLLHAGLVLPGHGDASVTSVFVEAPDEITISTVDDSPVRRGSDGYMTHTVTWRYGVDTWYSGVFGFNNRVTTIAFNVAFSEFTEAELADVPRNNDEGDIRMLVDPSQPQVVEIAEHIMTLETSAKARLNYALKFVQTLEYVNDIDSKGIEEYWSLPAETLYTMSGDCEDLAFLYVSIAEAMGYDAVLISMSGHLAAAVSADGLSGDYVNYGGVKYYYCETAARDASGINLSGFSENVGEMPEHFCDSKVLVFQIGPIT